MTGFAQVELDILVVENFIVVNLSQVGNDASLLGANVFNRVDGLIGGNGVSGHEQVSIDALDFTKGKVVHVFQVVVEIFVDASVDDGVDEVEVEIEGILFSEIVFDGRIIDARSSLI